MRHLAKTLLPLLLLPLLLASCVKEEDFLYDSSASLTFSEDTVLFDTVFATMATITHYVKVYNSYDRTINIDAVSLQGPCADRFRLNVDGDTARIARNVEIAPHDSIFIFIQANINPNDQTSPYLVEASIAFDYNNKRQLLPLVAYGRNAVYHLPTHTHSVYQLYINSYGNIDTLWIPFSIIDCDNWNHTLPHVIFGYAVVNSNQTLRLSAGDELYFADNACLWVYDSASLVVNGTRDKPVLFTSLRHDSHYDSLPGQWNSVWLSSGSKDNTVDYAIIENAIIGIQADTNVNGNPTLVISNSIVRNHSSIGILAQGARVEGDNLLVSNCGENLLCLRFGGKYLFSNSTFANYWRYSSRKKASVAISNYYLYDQNTLFPRPIEQAEFQNCIVYGNYSGSDNSGEINLDRYDGCAFNISFSHCLLRSSLVDSANNVILNRDPRFADPYGHNYTPAADSPAAGAGNAGFLKSPIDLAGNPRNNPPAIGAFEPATE